MSQNPMLAILRKARETASDAATFSAAKALEYEEHAERYRQKQAEAEAAFHAADQAIKDIEAADRRRSIYGQEVVR